MKRLMEIPLGDGEVVLAEVQEDDPGWVRAADVGELAERTQMSVAAALEVGIKPLAGKLRESFAGLRPDEVEVEFGLRLSGKLGVVFSSTEAEGHIQVRLSWSQSKG